jgi:hypothetical protein
MWSKYRSWEEVLFFFLLFFGGGYGFSTPDFVAYDLKPFRLCRSLMLNNRLKPHCGQIGPQHARHRVREGGSVVHLGSLSAVPGTCNIPVETTSVDKVYGSAHISDTIYRQWWASPTLKYIALQNTIFIKTWRFWPTLKRQRYVDTSTSTCT